MRVSDNTNFGVVRDSLNRSRSRLENLQTQNSTLKKLNKPSDDPVGSGKILEMRTDKVNNDQFQSNAKFAQSFLENTDAALEDLTEVIMRAKEIAIGQSSSASSTPETRLGVSEEVNQLFQRAIGTSNRRIGDRFVFGGFQNNSNPVDAEGNYHGDDGEVMLEIGREVFIGMNIPGIQIFNTNPEGSVDQVLLENRKTENQNRESPPTQNKTDDKNSEPLRRLASEKFGEKSDIPNANIFDELKSLRIGLLTGDQNAIRGTLDRFDELLAKVVSSRSKIGSRIQGIQGNITAMERHNVTNAQLSSGIEDADMTQIVSDMAKEETIFKSSLASSKHLIQPTLLDFLR
jgi:flagellar hook-associated protein 3 FlgL